jgi:hypothetical protein
MPTVSVLAITGLFMKLTMIKLSLQWSWSGTERIYINKTKPGEEPGLFSFYSCNIATYFSNLTLGIGPAEIVILGIIHGHRRPLRIKSLKKVK